MAVPALGSLKARGWLADGGLAVVEVGAGEESDPPFGYTVLEKRAYGAANVLFLKLRG